jgi:hypothetical protein
MEEDFASFLEDFCDMLTAFEASITKMKQQIAKLVGAIEEKPKFAWNPNAIKWERVRGPKGEFERSEDVNSVDFKALMKDLAAHDGKLTRDGWFYWSFPKKAVIGRKQRRR